MSKSVRNVAAIRTPRKNKKYSIVIPAAGMGTRMITYGAKPLIKLNGRETIISRQLAIIDKVFSNYEVILVAGFQAEKVMNHTPNHIIKVENTEYEKTNVARSIGMGLRAATTDNVVVIYGDLVFNVAALKAPFDLDSLLLLCNSMKKEEVGCILSDGKVQQLFYGIDEKWAQIMYLTGKELQQFKQLVWNHDNDMRFGFEILNHIIDRGGSFKAYKPKNAQAIDVDASKDIERAKTIL